jgi:hypothetical protein
MEEMSTLFDKVVLTPKRPFIPSFPSPVLPPLRLSRASFFRRLKVDHRNPPPLPSSSRPFHLVLLFFQIDVDHNGSIDAKYVFVLFAPSNSHVPKINEANLCLCRWANEN